MVAVCAAIASSSCGGGGTKSGASAAAIAPAPNTTAANAQIRIADYKFIPDTVRVRVGQVIRWTNEDNIGHNVRFTAATDTGPAKPIKNRAELMAMNRPKEMYASALFEKGESWTAKFDKAGKFAYICDPHPFMKAVIIVE
jgi:plastocyanin